MKPKVSIVIPVYNGSNYLHEAIDSALSQTYSNIEIIVVNDGSGDEGATRKVALSYGDRIRYFEKDNGGVASALNLGISKMEGEYFSWLSHDDIYLPNKVEREIEELEKTGNMHNPVTSGWSFLYMSDGSCRDNLPEGGIYSYSYYESGILSVLMGLIYGCSLLIHRSFFDKYGLFDEKLLTSQDYAKWFEMFRDKKIVYVNETLAKYRVHSNQNSILITDFMKNSEELHEWFANELKPSDSVSAGMDYYTLLGLAMVRFGNCGFFEAADIVAKKMSNVEEPDYGKDKREELKNVINDKSQDVYIYCMGNRGKTLIYALTLRGVNISGFSDGNAEICKNTIMGIKGIELDKLPRECKVIVSKENGKELVECLIAKGYENVILYEEIEQTVMETPIDKVKLLNRYQ